VFNQGKIEQIGTPADVYEYPATAFVAGFVGVSNLVDGDLAVLVRGTPETFTIRPEKIRIVAPDAVLPEGMCALDGQVREVTYLGMHTRYLVDVQGGSLVVAAQNLDTTSMDVLAARGQAVRLAWRREHAHVLH
jgi:putative spermidine/putrescine transport system ATP-binding protein